MGEQDSVSGEAKHVSVGIGSLLFVLIILITLFSAKVIDVLKIHFLNESAVSIIFGVMIGLIVIFLVPQKSLHLFVFDSEFFFFALLPPIVFEAGFSLKRKHFFRNMVTILIFAVLGTMISTLIIAMGLFSLSKLSVIPLSNDGNPLECLLFGTLISAVDPVSTLSVLGKKDLNVDPTLYSLIFGESLLNDAVVIVLFKIFKDYNDSTIAITFETHFFTIIGQFLGIFVGSFLVGSIIALIASAILKNAPLLLYSIANDDFGSKTHKQPIHSEELSPITNDQNNNLNDSNNKSDNLLNNEQRRNSLDIDLNNDEEEYVMDFDNDIYEIPHDSDDEYPALEFSLIILFAYLSYNLGEVCSLSGIVSVFSCGICMAHYSWYNMSWITQISSQHIIKALAKCCENFVYAYLGIATVFSVDSSPPHLRWSVLTILCSVTLCLFARMCNIFPFSALANLRRKKKISWSMQLMMWFAGLRGAIAFALSLNMRTANNDIIVTTTLSIVILSTLICGCSTNYMLTILKLNQYHNVPESQTFSHAFYKPHNNDDYNDYNNHNNNNRYQYLNDSNCEPNNNKYTGIHLLWHNFDRKFMMKWFGGKNNVKLRRFKRNISPLRLLQSQNLQMKQNENINMENDHQILMRSMEALSCEISADAEHNPSIDSKNN